MSELKQDPKKTIGHFRTRIAPSPTGIAHIGTAWLSMFNLALARQNRGQFLIRIEDTDQARFVPEAEELIYEGLSWLGINYDEGGAKGGPFAPYHQSERLPLYQKYAEELIAKDQAYYCFATKEELEEMRRQQQARGELPRYDGRWRDADPKLVAEKLAANEPHVIRLKVPKNKTIKWHDLVRGEVSFNTADIDDQVLMKADGFPTYHLAVVVDDHLMKISHVLRGEEWISSTPKHLLLYEAFGWEPPQIAHMPLIRNADHSKLSKRKNDVSILSYREQGYLPEALRNYIALLGWSHPEGKEVFSLTEFLRVFSLDRVQKTGPIFDATKLDWYNGYYIRTLYQTKGWAALADRLEPFLPEDFPVGEMEAILALIYERLVKLSDFEELTSFFYRPIGKLDLNLLLKKSAAAAVAEQLQVVLRILAEETEKQWTAENLQTIFADLAAERDWHRSQFLMMIRVATTGRKATPPLFETMAVLGKKVSLERLQSALDQLLAEGKE